MSGLIGLISILPRSFPLRRTPVSFLERPRDVSMRLVSVAVHIQERIELRDHGPIKPVPVPPGRRLGIFLKKRALPVDLQGFSNGSTGKLHSSIAEQPGPQ